MLSDMNALKLKLDHILHKKHPSQGDVSSFLEQLENLNQDLSALVEQACL